MTTPARDSLTRWIMVGLALTALIPPLLLGLVMHYRGSYSAWQLGALVTVVAGIGCALATGTLIARRLLRPLAALADRADTIARGDTSGPPMSGPGEIGVLALALDAMVRRIGERTEQQLALARGDNMASVSVLSAEVAHQLSEPLANLLASAQRLVNDSPSGHPDRSELDLIVGEATHMKTIVASLRSYTRVRPADAESCDPNAVARQVHSLLAASLQRGRITFTVDVQRAPSVAIDSQSLQHILTTVAENAGRAMPSGGGIEISWAPLPGDVTIAIYVTDDGPPVAVADPARIFDPLFAASERPGVGLGYAVVKHLVLRVGGSVALIDPPGGRGARIRITLPRG